VGKTTKTVITRSRSIGKNPFEGRSQSTRTEETSLLPEDEARRLPLDEIIMVVDAQMPVRAKRIQYFDDRLFAAIHGAQRGELPFPQLGKGGGGGSGSESGGSGQDLKQDGIGAQPHRHGERLNGLQEIGAAKSASRVKKRSGAVHVVVEEGQRQQEMNFADQGEMQLEERDGGDRDRLDLAVDDLGGLEDQLKQGEGISS
uniref:type IV secretory system conjugative DNA transfer family protein n=1 Tax=Litoreibacter halocynthiae TaxID=1242689 RepID=UPI0024929CC4